MSLLFEIIAGLAGTFAMTLFICFASAINGVIFYVPAILGSMMTRKIKSSRSGSNDRVSLLVGNIIYYAIGVFFAVLYGQFLQKYHIANNLAGVLLFGALAGCLAVAFWYTFIRLHPQAPVINLKLYLPLIFLGHIVFALVMGLFF